MQKLTDILQLVAPADIQAIFTYCLKFHEVPFQLSYKNITSYLNTLFIFQMKHHNKRNDVAEGSSEAFKKPLCLKGIGKSQ